MTRPLGGLLSSVDRQCRTLELGAVQRGYCFVSAVRHFHKAEAHRTAQHGMRRNVGLYDGTVLSEEARQVTFGYAGKEWPDVQHLCHGGENQRGANVGLERAGAL